MPTYEYECEACGHRFDAWQKMTDEALKRCPECQGDVRRLVSGGAGIIFKGDGFYATDYRSESYKKRAKEDASSTESKSSSDQSDKGESKKKDDKKKTGPEA